MQAHYSLVLHVCTCAVSSQNLLINNCYTCTSKHAFRKQTHSWMRQLIGQHNNNISNFIQTHKKLNFNVKEYKS